MPEPQNLHDQIMFLLGEIKAEVKGVNNRLDIVNGRIGKHDTEINKIQSENDELRGERKGQEKRSAWIATMISLVVGVVSFFLDRFTLK